MSQPKSSGTLFLARQTAHHVPESALSTGAVNMVALVSHPNLNVSARSENNVPAVMERIYNQFAVQDGQQFYI
jgi:hypothetical protein